MNKQRKLILIAAAIGIISTFLPWIKISAGAFGYNVSQSTNGFHGIGIFYFILLIAAAIIAGIGDQKLMLQKNMRLAVIGAGVLALICLIISYSDVSDATSANGFGVVDASIGIGMILSFLAAIAVAVIPFVIKQAGESLGSDFAQLKDNLKAVQDNISSAAAAAKSKNVSPASDQNRMSELEKLIAWRNEGKITEAEYQDLKAKIIK